MVKAFANDVEIDTVYVDRDGITKTCPIAMAQTDGTAHSAAIAPKT
jgi:hypothetical protein